MTRVFQDSQKLTNLAPWPPTGIKWYFSDDAVAIAHGDCRDILPHLDVRVDLVLTDPPYGIRIQRNDNTVGGAVLANNTIFPRFHGDEETPSVNFLLHFERVIIWGGNYFAPVLPRATCWLVWDKRDGRPSNNFADCELAWTNLPGPARLYSHFWQGMLRDSEKGEHYHPTQKPVALMKWCLSLVPDAYLVLDPFMGSGTTLRAAKDLGRKAIGIEIEERYCEIAAKRMAQAVLL